MEQAPTPTSEAAAAPASTWLGTAAWIACSLLLVAGLTGIWLRMRDEGAGTSIANALIEGKRPVAPGLPTAEIDGDGAPGLPDCIGTGERGTAGCPGAPVIVVNHWASWCGPCKDEAPVLRDIAADYEGRVIVVGLDAGAEDAESDARDFVLEHDLDFPIVRGGRADKDAWGVGGYPETFVVGADGRLSAHVNGQVDAETLRAILDRELAEERA